MRYLMIAFYKLSGETVWFKSENSCNSLKEYHARAVKGGDLRSSADGAWVRIPLVLFLFLLPAQLHPPLLLEKTD